MSQLSTFYSPLTAASLGLGTSANVTFGSVTTGAVTGSGNATFGSIQNTPIGNTTPAAGSFTTLSANSSVTASAPALDLTQTWNNAAVAFRGVNWSFVETASSSSSEVLRISVGATGTSAIFNIRRDGNATFANGINVGTIGGSAGIAGQGGQWRVASNGSFAWTNAVGNAYGNTDLHLRRDEAGTLAQYNGTNPQTFRIYNTFTDASNHERGFMRWSSNVLQIGTEKAGTGSARTLEFVVDGTTRISINTSGVVSANAGVDVNTDARLANGLGLTIAQNRGVFWTDGSTNSGTRDVFLGRFAARQLALRLGASDPMAFQIYNAYTSTTNFERLNLRWDSNQFIIDAEAGSAGGTLRGIKIGSATSSLLGFYGVTPVDQPATVADPAGGGTVDAEARTAIGEVIDRLQELGLIA